MIGIESGFPIYLYAEGCRIVAKVKEHGVKRLRRGYSLYINFEISAENPPAW